MSAWRRSPTVALTLTGVFLVIQFSVPVSRLGEQENAQRFGWQMFSTLKPQPEFTLHTEDSNEPVDLTEILARVRDDLSLKQEIPEYLCTTVPDAVRVTWDDQEHQC